jgi:hypothetical protein
VKQERNSTPDIELVRYQGGEGEGKREREGGYNLEREEEGVVLARYTATGVFKVKNRGCFEVRKEFGDKTWDRMVLLTGLAIIEVSRRRSRQRRYNP